MKNMKRFFCLLTVVLLSFALLAGCASPDSDLPDTDEIDDGYGTVTRNGKHTLVRICHDRKAVYLYNYDEEHKLFDTAEIPEEIYDEDWLLSRFSFYDFDDDGNSDLQVYLSHSDMSESYIYWAWVEGEGYVYQWDKSRLYYSIVVRDPDDYDSEDAFSDSIYMYVGVWLSEENDQYDDAYIEFDWYGNWTLYAAGEIVDEGSIQNETEGGYIYSDSVQDSAINGSRVEVEGDRLYIPNLGSFTHLVSENNSGNGDPDGEPDLHQRDVAEFEGTWYCDNDPSAETYIIFDADGNWSFYQRAPGDTEGTEMDCGIICCSEEEVSTYYAESIMYDDMYYRVFDLDEDVLSWNDEYTYYRMD